MKAQIEQSELTIDKYLALGMWLITSTLDAQMMRLLSEVEYRSTVGYGIFTLIVGYELLLSSKTFISWQCDNKV